MTSTTVALLVASIAAFPALAAGDARSADWSIPRPMSAPSPDRPARVIDLTGAPYLQDGVRHAALLANDDLLLFGSGHGADRTTELSISVFDPASGAVETLWHGNGDADSRPVLAVNRKVAWFAASMARADQSGTGRDFFVLDIVTRRIWPLDRVYGDGVALVSAATLEGYWKARPEPDGGLLIQWTDWGRDDIWGKPRAYWGVASQAGTGGWRESFPYSYLPSPLPLFAQGGASERLPVRLGVSQIPLLKFNDARDPRPPPRAVGAERYYAPTDDGEYYSTNDLPTLPLVAAPGLQVQLFNRWFDPRTMLPCGPGNVEQIGEVTSTSTMSGPNCARYQGANVERVEDGRLVHVLSHGVGVAHAIAQRGRLVALGGTAEGFNLRGKPDPREPNHVSLWDAVAGSWLANFAFPPGDVRVTALLISDDARRLYALTASYTEVGSAPQSQLYIWELRPAWSAAGKG